MRISDWSSDVCSSDLEQKGMQKGIQKGIRETARKLKELGVDDDIIIKSTGISKEEIRCV